MASPTRDDRYDTRLDNKYGYLTPIDIPAEVAAHEPWFNQTLTKVNDSVVRLGIFQGEYHWHKHDAEDECFVVLEGQLHIDVEGRETVTLEKHFGYTVPRGVVHRTRALVKTIVLMVEAATVTPTGNEMAAIPDSRTIREVARGDFPQWLPLWDGYNAFYGRSGATALPAEITEATWERFFNSSEPVRALVAEAGSGRLVGLAHYLFHRSTTLGTDICYLQDLFTDEASRGAGVGRALIEAVCQRAKAAGSTRLYWQTHESNRTAMRLYDQVAERSGFLVYRRQLA